MWASMNKRLVFRARSLHQDDGAGRMRNERGRRQFDKSFGPTPSAWGVVAAIALPLPPSPPPRSPLSLLGWACASSSD